MTENSWNPWKVTTVGMALVIATALLTRLVVVNWAHSEAEPKVAPSAGISTLAPACESSHQGATQVTRSVKPPEHSSSARPRATIAPRKPRMGTPPSQPDQATAVVQEPVGSGDEPRGAMPIRGAMVEDAARPGKDAVTDDRTPGVSKTPRKFDWKALPRHDDPRARAAISESP